MMKFMRKNVVISWGTLLGIANDDAQSLEETVLAVFFFLGGGGCKWRVSPGPKVKLGKIRWSQFFFKKNYKCLDVKIFVCRNFFSCEICS